MDRNTPKLPANMRSAATLKNSPRKSSYTVGFPPNMPSFREKNVHSVQDKSDVLAQHSLSTIGSNSVVINNEFKNGTRSDVMALEAWTHRQLAEIHFKHGDDPASAHREKEKESADQLKVLDASAELLAKMVEVHCIDKARLLRKLWSSSADLFNSIYTELSSIIHELKLKLSDKTMLCNRLEETMNRVRTAATPGGIVAALTPQDRNTHLQGGRHNQNNHATAEPPLPFVDSQSTTLRALEEELLLKNQEMMQLQATLTSLAIWFPNFAKFNASILCKYLPPIDYLEELERMEREKEAEENRLQQLKQEEEARLALAAQKSSPSAKHRPTLNAIGENRKDGDYRKNDPNHPKKPDNQSAIEQEVLEVEIAQNYLLKDLKRLQGLGIGFAVLDPVELEAAKAAVTRNYALANSPGVFVHNNSTSGSANSNATVSPTNRANSANNATIPANAVVPKSFASALGRTSIALTNQFKHRLVTMKSFVEVQGDEYSLAPVIDVSEEPVPVPGVQGSGTSLSTKTSPTATTPKTRNSASTNNSLGAAAAAALLNVMQNDTSEPLQVGDTNNTHTTTDVSTTNNPSDAPRADVKMDDFFKLQNVRVSKVDADDIAATVQKLARTMSAKNKGLFAPTTNEPPSQPSLGQDSHNPDHNEYEQKYRSLLIEAQKLEVARAKAERKMKDDAKAHHKQLLRMSAHVTTLQAKLQASHHSANVMLQKIPHVVFTPMIGRNYSVDTNIRSNVDNTAYGMPVYEGGYNHQNSHTGSYPHSEDFYHSNTKADNTRAPEHTGTNKINTDSASLTTLHYMFDTAFSDINVLLNNSRVPRHRNGQVITESSGFDTNVLLGKKTNKDVKSRVSNSPPRSRGRSAPLQQSNHLSTAVRPLTLADIHHIIYRFCTHFVQSSPTAVSNNTADGTHLSSGSGLRDELYVQFGQGPDQYKFGNLNAVLNGQAVSLYNVHGVHTTASGSIDAPVKSAFRNAQYLEESSLSAGYVQEMQYGHSVDVHSRQPSVTFADEHPSVVGGSIGNSIVYEGAQNNTVPHEHMLQHRYTVFAIHLFQFLSSSRQKLFQSTATSTTALIHAIHCVLLQQRDLLHTHNTYISRPATGQHKSVSLNSTVQSAQKGHKFPEEGLVKCLLELFGVTLHTPVYTTSTMPNTSITPANMFAYLEYLNNADPRQHQLRQSVFFDVFMVGFQAMQRYISITSNDSGMNANTTAVQPHSFPLTATERILRRMFTIVGEDSNHNNNTVKRRNTNNANHTNATVISSISTNNASVGNNNITSKVDNSGTQCNADATAPSAEPHASDAVTGGHHSQSKYEREAQSAPWWRTLPQSAFATLKHDVRMIAVTEHRAQALSQMLGAASGSFSVEHHQQDADPVELRVDCYECILTCMNTVYAHHHRLMVVLMNMYRFLESLSIQHGVANRTYHLLLAHFLQSAYPSVQDVSNAFSLSNLAQGTFSFAPRTAIVVNLELMCELQALQGRGMLNKHTFADAVLRSVPNYLVHGLYHLLEPQSAAGAAYRAKLVSDGTTHLTSLQEMLQRAYQHLKNEAAATAATTMASNTTAAFNQSSKSHKRSTVVNEFTGASSPSGSMNNADFVGGKHTKRPLHDDPDLKAQPSHFKQNYLLNKLLYPEEAQVSHDGVQSACSAGEPSEEEYLLQEMLDCENLFNTIESTHSSFGSPNQSTHCNALHVTINPFIQKLLLHGKLSYDADVTGVLAASLAEVTFTTWAMQYVVETLSRLRGSSMRLKTLFKKDMKQYTYSTSSASYATDTNSTSIVANTVSTSTGGMNVGGSAKSPLFVPSAPQDSLSPLSPSLGGAKHKAPIARTVSATNVNANIGSIGDYVLVDILLGDVDLDLFVRVEAHYIRALQKKVFRAWSSAVEDVFED